MSKLVVIDDKELVGHGETWEYDKCLTLQEIGFLFRLFKFRETELERVNFNCSTIAYNRARRKLVKVGYLHEFTELFVVISVKNIDLPRQALDYLKQTIYAKLLEGTVKRTRKVYSDEFEHFFSIYPKRSGVNNKPEAYAQFIQRIKEGHTAEEMIIAATNYQIFCEKSGKIGTEFVRAARNFIGKNKIFLENVKYNKKINQGDRFNAAKFIT